MTRTVAFRSTVVMARHGYGRGEYRYFAYPLPGMVAGAARAALSASCCRSRTAWRAALGSGDPLPRHPCRVPRNAATPPGSSGRRRCCFATARAITIACTRICTASWVFPLQAAFLLTDPAGVQRRRVRADRAAAADAVAGPGRAADGGRGGDLRGQSPPGPRHARDLSRRDAPWGERAALRQPPHAGRDLARCG